MNCTYFVDRDMRDHFALGSALEDRFAWSVMSSSPSPDRKIFENACEKWDKWEYEQHHTASSHPYRSPNQHHLSKSHTTVNSSHAGNVNMANHSGNRAGHDYAGTAILPHARSQQDSRSKRASISSGSAMLPPTHRLSRAMRVFVAWKA